MTDFINEYLGRKVKDKVTGATGVVTSISYDLYGCIQAVVVPFAKEDEGQKGGSWYDIVRLTITSKKPVMDIPSFDGVGEVAQGLKGPANKPVFSKLL